MCSSWKLGEIELGPPWVLEEEDEAWGGLLLQL